MDVVGVLHGLAGVGATAELLRAGLTPSQLRSAVAAGEVWRPRKGRYMPPSLGRDVARAVRVGGCVACVSAAAHHGLWVPESHDSLHVAVPGHLGRLRMPRDRTMRWHPGAEEVVIHWTTRPRRVSQTIPDLILEVARCCGAADAFAVAESALHRGRIDASGWRSLLARSPVHLAGTLATASSASESGTESLVKLILQELGLNFRQQVVFSGVGRVDFVVGSQLVVEVDSREHHQDALRDRRRDAILGARGMRTLHFLYGQVMHDQPQVRAALIGAMVRGDTD